MHPLSGQPLIVTQLFRFRIASKAENKKYSHLLDGTPAERVQRRETRPQVTAPNYRESAEPSQDRL
jgi:hypothetical protein